MKKHKYFLSFILIICLSFYFFSSEKSIKITKSIVENSYAEENNNKLKPVNITKKNGFKLPLTALGIFIDELDNDLKNPVITAVFGYVEGEKGYVFNENIAVAEFELSSGTSLYEIKPILPLSGNSRFFTTIDTLTNTIESIRGIQTFDYLEVMNIERDKIEKIIKQKYTLVFDDYFSHYFKNEHGDLVILYVKNVNKKYELCVHYIDSH